MMKTTKSNHWATVDSRILALKKQIDAAKHRSRLKEKPFAYKPFSKKQKQVLTWWREESPVKHKDGIIADGAIRSGKTLSMSLSFGLWGMSTFDDQNFLICGKTIGSLRRNVVYDFKRQMRAHGYKIHDNRTDNMLVISKGGASNRFYLFGGRDERSQDLVQGITAAGVLCDEVALMPRSFVEQAIARCSVDGSKFWFNCNPSNPYHWFKTHWINRIPGVDEDAEFNEDNPAKNLAYLHFTMEDNLSLTTEVKTRYRSMFQGVFFKRFILGLWVMANGIIYDMFDGKKHVYKKPAPVECRRYIAVDYGTTNPTVFLAIADDGRTVWIEKEFYYNSRLEGRQLSSSEYGEAFDKFVAEWGYRPRRVVIDPSADSFRVELRRRGYSVKEADNAVLDGITLVSTLLTLGCLMIHESCINTIKEFLSYIWDEKAAENGVEKPIKQQDHALDALRYFIKTILKKRRFTPR